MSKVITENKELKSVLHTPFGKLFMLDILPRFKHGIDLYSFYVVSDDGYATHSHLPVGSWMVVELATYETMDVKYVVEGDEVIVDSVS